MTIASDLILDYAMTSGNVMGINSTPMVVGPLKGRRGPERGSGQLQTSFIRKCISRGEFLL